MTVQTRSRVRLTLAAGAAPVALAAALLIGPDAHAQAANTGPTQSATPAAQSPNRSDAGSIEEVVVTARKRTERLRDIPTAGTALGADAIREMGGIATAQQLLTNTPGVNFANTSNPVTSEVSIRGSGTSRATTAESGVGLFRNGAFIGGGTVAGRTFTDLDLFDVERIEVLRGTQGGLNGRNAEGGSVNVVSARPTHNFEGFAQADAGRHERYEGQLVVNVPLDDHWAVRLGAVGMKQTDGFYHLPLRGEYADQQYKSFYRGQVNYTNGGFTANLLAEHASEQLPGLVYLIEAYPSATYPTGYRQDRFEMPWNSPSAAKLRMDNFELTTSTELGFASLATTTMVRERHGQNAYDRDASSLQYVQDLIAQGKVASAAVRTLLAGDYGLGGNQTDTARIFYQDAHLTGEKVGGFSWVAGAEYYLLRDRPRSALAKTPTAANPSLGTIDVAQERFESAAVYGSVSYDVTDKLNLAADLRYTRDKEDFLTQRLDYGTFLPIASTAFSIAGSTKDDNVSYTLSASYKPVADWLVYAKIGAAYRPGGFNTSLGDPRQPKPVPGSYDPETLTSYEIGFKGNLAPNLYVTAAAYDNRFKDLIIQGDNGCFVGSPVCPVQQTVFAFNAGPANLWGVELEATARFEVFDGPLRVSVGGSRQGGHIGHGVYDGRRQPQQPDYTATFNVNYRHELTDAVTGFMNLKGSGRWGGVQEIAQVPPLDDYLIADARAGVEWGRYELALHVENLFDKSYVVFQAPTAINNVIRYNFPRTYGVTLRYTW